MNFPEGSPALHLSYHDGEHYNSVRMAEDYGEGPPVEIVIRPGGVAGGAAGMQVRRNVFCLGFYRDPIRRRGRSCSSHSGKDQCFPGFRVCCDLTRWRGRSCSSKLATQLRTNVFMVEDSGIIVIWPGAMAGAAALIQIRMNVFIPPCCFCNSLRWGGL